MKKYYAYLVTSLLLFPFCNRAEIPTVPLTELVPAQKHQQANELITHILSTYHYKKTILDDTLSGTILDKYLESLDQNKSYFLKTDIDEFQQYNDKLDDDIKGSDLSPAFEIFKRYRQRVAERISYAHELLAQDFSFDVDEDYLFDRREGPWAADKTELDEIWRKRIKNDVLNLHLAKKSSDETRDTLLKRYTRTQTSTFQLDANDIFQAFINAYATAIEPHTAYLSPRTSENFDISMRLSLEGIGAVLRGDSDYTQVVKVIPGGPADLSGQLHADDRITGVGQNKDGEIIDVIGWRLDDVVDLIRGPKGTVLRLEILPEGTGPEEPGKVITLTRNNIKLEEQAASSSVIEIPGTQSKIGVIDVPTFYIDFAAQAKGDDNFTSTSRDVRNLIAELLKQDIDGLTVDLRGNGGGSLTEALELTGLFIEKGPIVQTRDASGKVEINNDPDPTISYSGPLAVLVDRNSASASEIFAGAIQDYHRGIIIGEPTFGKGTVQNVIDLNRFIKNSDEDHGRLKTTIAQFFRVSGGSNQFTGVIPDIIFPTVEDASHQGERAFDNALPWDKVKPARYLAASAPVDNFSLARKRHEERIKNNKLFQLMLDEHRLAGENSEKKQISLLESKRKEERDKILKTKKTIQDEIRIAKGLPPLPDDTDIDIDADPDSETDEAESIDVLLNETAQILYDLVVPDNVPTMTQHTVDQPNSIKSDNNL
ncbi:MAG: tail-specific protease [Gammaproteobacteria bacterium RBG_16_51_14]|nr:MAG: tail-specific protease [Gammaproteobacteria bacterium RBG_16_51_14]